MVQKSEIHILSIHTLRRRTEGWTAKMDGELTDTQLSSLTHDLTRWQRHLDLVLAHHWMTCGRLNTMMDYSGYKIVLLKWPWQSIKERSKGDEMSRWIFWWDQTVLHLSVLPRKFLRIIFGIVKKQAGREHRFSAFLNSNADYPLKTGVDDMICCHEGPFGQIGHRRQGTGEKKAGWFLSA